MKVELPICISDVDVVTDCWIYNRLAIIKTSGLYKDWIASHYDLYMDNCYNFLFGDIKNHAPSYHDEILERNQIHLSSIKENNIVELLCDELKNENYIVMHSFSYDEEYDLHEILIFGFDDVEKYFSCVKFSSRQFIRTCIPFFHFEASLNKLKEAFSFNSFGLEMAVGYQYPITSFKIRKDYDIKNCVFEAYQKIRNEIRCGEINKYMYDDFFKKKDENHHIYTGLMCLKGFSEMLNMEIKHIEFEEWFRGVVSGVKKIYEHQTLIFKSLNYIYDKWNYCMDKDVSITCINEYQKCCNRIKLWVNMTIKYELTGKVNLLQSIVNEIPEIYEKEYKILTNFIDKTIDWKIFNKLYI